MPAQPIKVRPPALLQAAASVANTAEQAAEPHPGAVPVATPGSPSDGAWAGIAAGIATQSAAMGAEVAGVGPLIRAKTQGGVAHLRGQDEQNAAQIQAVGQSSVFTV